MTIFILYKVDIVKLLNYVDRHILRKCVFNQTAHDWNVFLWEEKKPEMDNFPRNWTGGLKTTADDIAFHWTPE